MEFRDRSQFRDYLMEGLDDLKLSEDTLASLYRFLQKGADPEELKDIYLRVYRDAFSYFQPFFDKVNEIEKLCHL